MTPPAAPFGELDELYEKATKGPWMDGQGIIRADAIREMGHTGNAMGLTVRDQDSALIVALVNAYPALKAAHAAAIEESALKDKVLAEMCEDEDECRKLLAQYDRSDSYGVDSIQTLIERAHAAARNDALEEAARVCDARFAELVIETRQHLDRGWHVTGNELHHQATQAKEDAAAIRALKAAR